MYRDNDNLKVYASGGVYDGCEIRHRVHDSDSADISCDYGHAEFAVEFTANGLREFTQHCTEILRKMEEIAAHEDNEPEQLTVDVA